MMGTVSKLSNSPGCSGPGYSSSTGIKAHECLFRPSPVFDSTFGRGTGHEMTRAIPVRKICISKIS
jgi:hypothetical protein